MKKLVQEHRVVRRRLLVPEAPAAFVTMSGFVERRVDADRHGLKERGNP